MADLPADEANAICAELGLEVSMAPQLHQACYDLLDLTTFFTVGSDEVRAWMIPLGATALQAAGAIHSDLERYTVRDHISLSSARLALRVK